MRHMPRWTPTCKWIFNQPKNYHAWPTMRHVHDEKGVPPCESSVCRKLIAIPLVVALAGLATKLALCHLLPQRSRDCPVVLRVIALPTADNAQGGVQPNIVAQLQRGEWARGASGVNAAGLAGICFVMWVGGVHQGQAEGSKRQLPKAWELGGGWGAWGMCLYLDGAHRMPCAQAHRRVNVLCGSDATLVQLNRALRDQRSKLASGGTELPGELDTPPVEIETQTAHPRGSSQSRVVTQNALRRACPATLEGRSTSPLPATDSSWAEGAPSEATQERLSPPLQPVWRAGEAATLPFGRLCSRGGLAHQVGHQEPVHNEAGSVDALRTKQGASHVTDGEGRWTFATPSTAI